MSYILSNEPSKQSKPRSDGCGAGGGGKGVRKGVKEVRKMC